MDDAETEQFIPANNLLAYDVADRYEEEGNIETAEAVRNYIAERARRNGMANEALHNRDKRFAEVDAITNDDGNIYSITLGNGVKGYVVGKSRVITRDDSSIDTAATVEANEGGYIYVNEDGKVRTVVVNGLATLDSVKSAQEEKKAISQEEYAVFQANYDAMTAAPAETQEATPASAEVTPESAAPAETAVAPVNNTPAVSNEVAENAARALGVLPEELEEVILDEQEGLERAARYNNIGDTDSADAIRAYVAERFGTPAVQPAQVNNATAAEVGNNVADKREQSTSSLDAMPSESNLGEANGAENIPAEQAPENVAPVIPVEKRGKEERQAFHLAPVERTTEELYNSGLDQQEIDAFVQANIDEINSDIEKHSKKQPKMGANIAAYKAAKEEWQAQNEDLAARLNYYKGLQEHIKGITTSNTAEAINDPIATRESETVGRGGEVLQDEQPTNAGGTEPIGTGQQGGAAASSVQSNGANVATPGNQAVSEPVGNSEQLNQSEDNLEMGARLINEVSKEDHPSVIAANEGQDTVGGSPVTLAYLLEGGKGSILNAGYFLHGVAAAFPEITNEIEAIRRGMSDDVLGMSPIDFAAQRAEEIAIISELIEGKYGEEGLSVFSELLNNADGFYPREGLKMSARIEALQPVNSSTNALQNENNNLNLQQENVSDNESNQNNTPVGGQVSESIPQGEHRAQTAQAGGMEETAARLRERIEADGRAPQTGVSRNVREVENRVTREYAQESGLWIPFEDVFKLGRPSKSGNEHDTYLNAEQRVICKVNNRMNTPSILDLLDRMELHNKYFLDSKYSLIGFTAVSENGDVWPVFAQEYVPDSRMASIQEIDDYMGALGFTRVGDGRYSNGEVIIKDLKPRNVLADTDGDIYVVDAEFEQEKENTQNGGEISQGIEDNSTTGGESGSSEIPNNSTISQESEQVGEQVEDEKVLSQSEYADVRSAEIMADNINLDDVEAYNMALDEYPKYIGDMIKSGKLSQIYKKATVGERIALNKMIQAAGYEISDVNTQEVKEDSKKAESKFKVGDVVTATFGDGSVVSAANLSNTDEEDDALYRSDDEVPRLTKHRIEKIFGGIWIDDAEDFAKFASAVNNSPFEEDGEGIAFTDNYFYAYYLNIDGQVIPFASVYLNSLERQEVVNQVNQEIKDGRKEKGAKEYFNTAVERYERLNSQNYADNGNNSSASNRGNNVRLGNYLLQKGRYYDRPNLYVKTQRADRFGLIDDYSREGYSSYTDDEVYFENDPISKVLGKPRFTRKQRREFAERERQRMVARVDSLAKKLHLDNVEIVTDTSTLTSSNQLPLNQSSKLVGVRSIAELQGKKQRAKGFYSKSTGKITIVIPNHRSTFDVEQTLLHEAVAHYGLRQLFENR